MMPKIATTNEPRNVNSAIAPVMISGPIVRASSPPDMKIDIARPIRRPPYSPTSETAGAWNIADARPEMSSRRSTTVMFGARPSDDSEMAASPGATTTNQRRLVRSAT